ncbi:BREX-6 system BrxE protein [Nannocystaceae bacterium ST9]
MLVSADLDEILTMQLAVAWAGESADEEEPRLGWWRSDLVSKYGGIALFERLAPRTAAWAVYEAAREAARLVDTEKRSADASPHHLISLFHLGFEVDEQLDDRLLALKHAGEPPERALPRLAELPQEWEAKRFTAWLVARGKPPKTESRLVLGFTHRGRFRIAAFLEGADPDQTKVVKVVYDALAAQRDELERSLGSTLTWERNSHRRASRVSLMYPREVSVMSSAEAIEQLAGWVADHVRRFRARCAKSWIAKPVTTPLHEHIGHLQDDRR